MTSSLSCCEIAFSDSCEQFFGAKDLYAALRVEKNAKAEEIKKAYYKLSLKVHPDRASTSEKEDATTKFQVLGKIYSVLSDKERRTLYDQTGIIDEEEVLDKETDWYAFWRLLFKLSEDDIRDFEKNYKENGEELKDLKESYLEFEGDMDQIMANVLCCTADDEERFRQTLQELIESEELPEFDTFSKENKKKKSARKRKAKKEAKEAEEMKKEFYSKASIQEDSGNALATMIQSRQNQRMDSLMANLEAKYCQPKKTKKKGTAKVTKGKNK
ncbi:dnaJ homolog subfamily C member 9-like isoform X1 [Apostichopus japonicus]|uniref:dnaJ homolog subfamily C member 9-like isoform X1 n=1 Tax=Stichopus japonicus TaxID=307972 RepID=UPI003AB7C9E9